MSDRHKITARAVPDRERALSLPIHFGGIFAPLVEITIYDVMRDMAPDYCGAFWHLYELSNGGFYMAPKLGALKICITRNSFTGLLSADGAGITACLLAYSHLALARHSESLADHYRWLLDFTTVHAEGEKIIGAVS